MVQLREQFVGRGVAGSGTIDKDYRALLLGRGALIERNRLDS